MTKTSAINRIHDLLDDNSFVEVGAYITARSTDYNMQSQETPADGVVTGYGTINGALVYVYSQDASGLTVGDTVKAVCIPSTIAGVVSFILILIMNSIGTFPIWF